MIDTLHMDTIMDILQETILNNLPTQSRKNNKCINFNCPCCTYMGESRNDTKGRGGLFPEYHKTGYNCFNCGFKFLQPHDKPLSGRTKKFLELLNVSMMDIQKVVFQYRKNDDNPLSHLKRVVTTINESPKLDLDFVDCELPHNTHFLSDIIDSVDQNHNAFKAYCYAADRNIQNYPFLMWSSSTEHRMNEYLILPFIFKDRIVGYQARYFGDHKWTKENRRFINKTPNTGKFIYGLENIFKKRKYLFINESPIDSIIYNGVGVMSHSMSNKQINLINSFKGTKILIPDFGNGGKKMVDTAIRNEWSVYFPFWDDGKDLGDATNEYGRLFMTAEIIQNSLSYNLSIKVKQRSFFGE